MPSNTEFCYFLTIDTRQYELPNYLLKIGGYWPLKGRYDVICHDVISTKWLITQNFWISKGGVIDYSDHFVVINPKFDIL